MAGPVPGEDAGQAAIAKRGASGMVRVMPTPLMSPPAADPVMHQRRSSMEGQVKVIGALQIVFGALAIVGALFILISGDFAADAVEEEGDEPEAAALVRSIMSVLGGVLLIYGALGIIGAIGLFNLQPWGRGVSFAFLGISLIQLPFGTALGIWGLIVLTRPETAELFRGAPA